MALDYKPEGVWAPRVFSRHVLLEGDPEADPLDGLCMYPFWPGNVLGSFRRSLIVFLGRYLGFPPGPVFSTTQQWQKVN